MKCTSFSPTTGHIYRNKILLASRIGVHWYIADPHFWSTMGIVARVGVHPAREPLAVLLIAFRKNYLVNRDIVHCPEFGFINSDSRQKAEVKNLILCSKKRK